MTIGNVRLLTAPDRHFAVPNLDPTAANLDEIERSVEQAVLAGKIIVINTRHHAANWHRAGCVPLRWGAPRIILCRFRQQVELCASGQELARSWRLWRYQFDASTDCATTTLKPPLERPACLTDEMLKTCEAIRAYCGNAASKPLFATALATAHPELRIGPFNILDAHKVVEYWRTMIAMAPE